MKLYYKDFVTGKKRFTRGKPIEAMKGGPLQAWGLVVRTRSTTMFIPGYLLEPEGKEILEEAKIRKEEKHGSITKKIPGTT